MRGCGLSIASSRVWGRGERARARMGGCSLVSGAFRTNSDEHYYADGMISVDGVERIRLAVEGGLGADGCGRMWDGSKFGGSGFSPRSSKFVRSTFSIRVHTALCERK